MDRRRARAGRLSKAIISQSGAWGTADTAPMEPYCHLHLHAGRFLRIRAPGAFRQPLSRPRSGGNRHAHCRSLSLPLAFVAALAALPARPGRRADNAEDQHLGRAELALRRRDRHVRARGREAHQRPLQDPDVLRRRARRRARIDRRRPARHARPHADVDGPAAEFRAGSRDPRHSVPVPRLRACARRARRPDRPGDAAEVSAEGHRRARVGRERLSPHDQQQARRSTCPTT